jgi:hypothetical protein
MNTHDISKLKVGDKLFHVLSYCGKSDLRIEKIVVLKVMKYKFYAVDVANYSDDLLKVPFHRGLHRFIVPYGDITEKQAAFHGRNNTSLHTVCFTKKEAIRIGSSIIQEDRDYLRKEYEENMDELGNALKDFINDVNSENYYA